MAWGISDGLWQAEDRSEARTILHNSDLEDASARYGPHSSVLRASWDGQELGYGGAQRLVLQPKGD